MVKLRFIGDVHGKIPQYLKLIKDAEYSVQVGDMGFASNYEQLKGVDGNRHRFLEGNHDDYDNRSPLALGDYGECDLPTYGPIFFVRGAWSIDHKHRVVGKSWWAQEELSYEELMKAFELYKEIKPDVMVTHDCPSVIGAELGDPEFARQLGYDYQVKTRTGECLQAMFEYHQPLIWIFGHWHKSWHQVRLGTEFHCLNELETLDVNKRYIPSTIIRR